MIMYSLCVKDVIYLFPLYIMRSQNELYDIFFISLLLLIYTDFVFYFVLSQYLYIRIHAYMYCIICEHSDANDAKMRICEFALCATIKNNDISISIFFFIIFGFFFLFIYPLSFNDFVKYVLFCFCFLFCFMYFLLKTDCSD